MFRANEPNQFIPSKSVAIKPDVVSSVGESDQIRINIPSFIGFIDPNQTYFKCEVQMKNCRGQVVPDPDAGGIHALFRNVLLRDGNNQTTLEMSEDYNANCALLNNYVKQPSLHHKAELFSGEQRTVGSSNNDESLFYKQRTVNSASAANPDTTVKVAKKVMVQTPLKCGLFSQGNILPVSAMNGLRIEIETEEFLRGCRILDKRGDTTQTHPTTGFEATMVSANKTAGDEDRAANTLFSVETSYLANDNPFAINDILYVRDAGTHSGAGNEEVLGTVVGFFTHSTNNPNSLGISYIPLRNTGVGLAHNHNTNSILNIRINDRETAYSYYLLGDGAGNVKNGRQLAPTYELSNIEMIVQSVQPPPNYVAGLLKASQSEKGVSLDILTYELHRHNQANSQGLVQASIPTNVSRAKALFSQPLSTTAFSSRSLYGHSLTGNHDGAKNYEWVYGTQHYPSRLAPLTRIHNNGVEALHLSELQKAIVNVGEKVRNLNNVKDNFCVARSLTKYGQIMDLSEQSLSIRIDYSSTATQQKLLNNYVYHLRRITINKNGVMVMN